MKKMPPYWHGNNPVSELKGLCARCGTLYQAEKKFQKADPAEELCTYCAPIGAIELAELNPEV